MILTGATERVGPDRCERRQPAYHSPRLYRRYILRRGLERRHPGRPTWLRMHHRRVRRSRFRHVAACGCLTYTLARYPCDYDTYTVNNEV